MLQKDNVAIAIENNHVVSYNQANITYIYIYFFPVLPKTILAPYEFHSTQLHMKLCTHGKFRINISTFIHFDFQQNLSGNTNWTYLKFSCVLYDVIIIRNFVAFLQFYEYIRIEYQLLMFNNIFSYDFNRNMFIKELSTRSEVV